MTDPTCAALSQPEPAGLSDEELLKALKLAINSFPPAHPDAEGMSCAQYEVTLELRKARAVEAATLARAQRQPGPLPTHDLSNVAPLLWVLWNHLGARSPVGQPIREYLGMGQFQPMTDAQMAAANQYRALLWNSPQPEPAGQIPPDYIDPQHTGPDRELLQAFYAACQSEGGTADEVTLRGLRAAIAADRARAALAQPEPEGPTEREWDALVESAWDKHRTVGYHGERFIYEGDFDTALGFVREELARWGNHPGSPDSSGNLKTGLTGSPADGEVVELVVALRADAECVEVEHYDLCNMTADQMRRAADLLERLSPPQPVPVSEWQTGLPPSAGFYYVRGLLDEGIGGDNRPVFVNPKDFVWGFWELDDPEWIGLDSDITPESIQWKPVSSTSHPVPVPVSERLPDNRDPECVANWPECWSGGYDPRCCRFPKSCSCERGALPLPVEVEG